MTSSLLQNRSPNIGHQNCDWSEENKIFRGPAPDHLLSNNMLMEPMEGFRCMTSIKYDAFVFGYLLGRNLLNFELSETMKIKAKTLSVQRKIFFSTKRM